MENREAVVRCGSLPLLIVVELRRRYHWRPKAEAFKKKLEEDPEYQTWGADLRLLARKRKAA
jgi:hypothetical protein